MSIYQTIKKYFLFLSVFFVFATSAHLIFLYFVEDSIRSPEEGGTVNIGFIGAGKMAEALISKNDIKLINEILTGS